MSPVTWSILFPTGEIKQGRGLVPPPGWFNDVKDSLGVALLFAGYPPVYAIRPTCSNDVDRVVFADGGQAEAARFWGVQPEPGSSAWFYPNAKVLGLGRDTSEVERLIACFQGKLEAERVAGGPDQRGRPE